MKVFLAGRVAFERDGRAVDDGRFPGRQGRLLFAYLAAEEGRAVPREQLADALWGETVPATWDKALTVLVSKLRALLTEHGVDGAAALTSGFGCYRLKLPPGSWIDIRAAADRAGESERALAAGDPEAARAAGAEAEAIARQPFLPGEVGTWVEEARRGLADVRARAVATLAEAALRAGDTRAAANWAEQAVGLEPFRETGYRLLMEAHAAEGNRAEALRIYEHCRVLLAEELGAYPSPETQAIHRRLLDAPPAPRPAPPPPEAAPPRDDATRRPRRRLAGVALAVAALGAVLAGVILAERGGGSRTPLAPNSLVALDPSGAVAATVPVGAGPVAIAPAGGSLWVANGDDRTVSRVDASTRTVVRTIPVGRAPTALAAGGGGVLVADRGGAISEIDPRYDDLDPMRRLPSAAAPDDGAVWPMLAAFGSTWVVDPDGYVTEFRGALGRRIGSVDVGNGPSAIAAGAGSIWVANRDDGTLTRIDPVTLVATTIPVGHGPAAVAVDGGGVWVANAGDGTLVRIDPETDAVASTTRIGDGPTAMLATPGALWVANGGDGTVTRADPRTGAPTATIRLGGAPSALAYAGGRVWVALGPAPPPAPRTGGVARLTLQHDLPSLDPALEPFAAPQIFYATCANLVTYPDGPAPAGSRIVPEVAEAVPAPTDGGRTYTFVVRPGFRFSPGSSRPVTARTFKSTIERVVDPGLRSPLASQFSAIVGYPAVAAGRARGLRGIVARGRTLTIRLSRPDGALLSNLAGGAACAVPTGTPAVPGGLDDIPSAGPYYVASYTPGRQLVLRRNPDYHGGRPRRFDELVIAIGVDASRALREVEAGTADYALDGLPRDAGATLQARYGAGSRAERDGDQRYFVSTANGMRLLHMNTSRPLFSRARLRRAVNYAIDRRALVAQGRRFAEVNPFNAGRPTADYASPAIAGARHLGLYPLEGPDLRRAKRLAGHVHATAVMYTPDLPPWLQEAQIVRRDLRPLGIDVQVHAFPLDDFFARIGRRGEPFDLAVSGYAGGSTDPAQDVQLFDGRTIRATGNSDYSYFDDPAFDRRIDAASELSGARRYRVYGRLQVELERTLVPAAAFATDASRDFFSARVGCQVYQPVFGIDLGALCLRR